MINHQIIYILLGIIITTPSIQSYSPFRTNGLNFKSTNNIYGGVAFYNIQSPLSGIRQQVDQFNPFDIIYQWKMLDFEYTSLDDRQNAIADGTFVPQNNLPLGIDTWRDRIFITMPRWKNGVPASLAWLPLPPTAQSPPMIPYPDWSYHGDPENPDCSKLMSVYRLQVDECERLWVIDAGVVNATIKINQVCPPKIVVFDLKTDTPIFSYEFPKEYLLEGSLYTNILVDVRNGQCDDAHAYIPDVWRYGIVVVSMKEERSWRVTNHLFQPTPQACNYNLHDINFQWTDGVFGMTLSPLNQYQDRLLFFNPMSSYGEFMVSSAVIRNESLWVNGTGLPNAFVQIGTRGVDGQSSTAHIDRNNIMFFNLVHQDAIGCWDTSKPYSKENLGVIARDNETLIFPNDSKVDKDEIDQGLWVLSNRLPIYLYSTLDYSQINFRIQRVSTTDVVAGSICDPLIPAFPPNPSEQKCF